MNKQKESFWKARTSVGRPRLFKSAEALLEACCEYFEWVEQNPLYETKMFTHMGSATLKEVPKMRAMTVAGLSIFLDINQDTWNAWRKVDDFSVVTARVDNIIRTQKFEGASADLLNANIIARDLGLAEKSKMDLSNEDGSMSQTLDMTKLSTAAIKELLDARTKSEPDTDGE